MAQAAGISVQQVRNYVELGILPPTARTASGYRIFTDDHAAALTVARRLADGHGWTRTRQIMRAVHDGDLDTVLAVLDASHAEAGRDRSLPRLRAAAALYAYLRRRKLIEA
nr:MerR family DNA-binding transcriptional regulator [Planosporangium thailandense]